MDLFCLTWKTTYRMYFLTQAVTVGGAFSRQCLNQDQFPFCLICFIFTSCITSGTPMVSITKPVYAEFRSHLLATGRNAEA